MSLYWILYRGDPQADMIAQAHRRKDKIERFRQQKQTEVKLKELHAAVNREHVDEEVKVRIWQL